MIENSVKDQNWMFRNFFVEDNGVEKDVLEDGRLSCAVFVSSILYLFNSGLEFTSKQRWIKFTHANIPSTEKDMQDSGWYEIKELKPGSIIIWEKKNANNSENWHMGFYVGNDVAISNDSGKGNTGIPHRHHYTYNDTRKIEKIYWHPELDQD